MTPTRLITKVSGVVAILLLVCAAGVWAAIELFPAAIGSRWWIHPLTLIILAIAGGLFATIWIEESVRDEYVARSKKEAADVEKNDNFT